jgi:hypothetical protein
MKQWIRRLWCAHTWKQVRIPQSQYEVERMVDGYNFWLCTHCGKRIARRPSDPPISFVQ